MGIDPYDAKTKPNAITSDRPYAGCSRFLGVGRVDVGIDPYDAKWEINTDSPENRHKTGAFGGSM